LFTAQDYINEVKIFIEKLNCRTIFRSNHASNILPLEGVFPKDKDKLLKIISNAHVSDMHWQFDGY
jgi:hypothetical protein